MADFSRLCVSLPESIEDFLAEIIAQPSTTAVPCNGFGISFGVVHDRNQ